MKSRYRLRSPALGHQLISTRFCTGLLAVHMAGKGDKGLELRLWKTLLSSFELGEAKLSSLSIALHLLQRNNPVRKGPPGFCFSDSETIRRTIPATSSCNRTVAQTFRPWRRCGQQ